MANSDCGICKKLAHWKDSSAFVIRQTATLVVAVGDHQFYPGYCAIYLREHVREMHLLSARVQQEVFAELMAVSRAIDSAYQPWKLNLVSLGNVAPHVHWHLMPRYESDVN